MARVKTEFELHEIVEELAANKGLLHLISVASSCTDEQLSWAAAYCEHLRVGDQTHREHLCVGDQGVR